MNEKNRLSYLFGIEEGDGGVLFPWKPSINKVPLRSLIEDLGCDIEEFLEDQRAIHRIMNEIVIFLEVLSQSLLQVKEMTDAHEVMIEEIQEELWMRS